MKERSFITVRVYRGDAFYLMDWPWSFFKKYVQVHRNGLFIFRF